MEALVRVVEAGSLSTAAPRLGSPLPDALAALDRGLAELERSLPDLTWMEEARLAMDLGEIHRRLLPLAEGDVALLRERLAHLHSRLTARSESHFAGERGRLREGGLRGAELASWLAAQAPAQRDLAIEHLLGIAHRPLATRRLDGDLVDYIPSGIAPIVRAVLEVPITPADVFVDLGAGLGKVALAVHLLSGAVTRGVELQPELAAAAAARAVDLGLEGVSFEPSDARTADLSQASVVFLYLPFTGATLATVMARLEAVARRRALVVITLGLDLRAFEWLTARATPELWLSIHDSRFPGAAPRPQHRAARLGPAAEAVAAERAAPSGSAPAGGS